MKKYIFFIIALLVFTVKISAEDVESNQIPAFTANLPDFGAICDNDYMTSAAIEASAPLVIASSEDVYAVYIIWETRPEPYIIRAAGWVINCGGDGFLHELVRFEKPVTEFEIETDVDMSLCDIYLFGAGELPEFVQDWKKPYKQADILLLSTHADDEVLMFGGTLPYYAKELGLYVQTAFLTDHEEEQPRPHELLDSLWAVGVTRYPVIGSARDVLCYSLAQAFAIHDEDALLEWTVEIIRRFKPSVMITHDVNGEYGHGAHMLSAYLTREAVSVTSDENAYPESAVAYGTWDVPKTYLHLWEENVIVLDWEMTLDSFSGITAREAAELGYTYHKSQHKWGLSVNYTAEWDCRRFGLYRTTVGIDTTADFMENITPLYVEELRRTEEAAQAAELMLAEKAAQAAESRIAEESTESTQETLSSAITEGSEVPAVAETPYYNDDNGIVTYVVIGIVLVAGAFAVALIVIKKNIYKRR